MLAEMTKLFNFLLFERVESDAACWTLLGMDKSWNILPSRYTIMYNLELFSKKNNYGQIMNYCSLKTCGLTIKSTKQLKKI